MTLADDPKPLQLDMFGGPAVPLEPAAPAPTPAPSTVARHVSAGRALRALQRSLPVVREADPDPPGLEGWRTCLDLPRPAIVNRTCSEWATLRRPDGALSPCGWVACPHHLAMDVGERVEVGPVVEAELVASTAGLPTEQGRRPSLSAIPETQGEIEAFTLDVIEAAARVPYTCTLEVVRLYPDGAPVEVVAGALGVSEEAVRLIERSAEAGYRAAGGELEPAPRMRVEVDRRLAEASPVPVAIVRIEREAPAPRELTEAEIFGGEW